MARLLTDTSSVREGRRQRMLQAQLERQFEKRFYDEMNRASRDIVEFWQQTGAVQSPRGHIERVTKIYEDLAKASYTVFGMRIFDQGKAIGYPLEVKEDFGTWLVRSALQYIAGEMIRQRIQSVADTTRSIITRAIASGFAEGLGQNDIARSIIDKIPLFNRSRANTIARTEIHGAANSGSVEAAKRTNLPMMKEWISTEDSRVRRFAEGAEYDHDAMNGVQVEMDEPFVVTSRKGRKDVIMQPGDPKGAPGNIINCRCAVGFVVKNMQSIEEDRRSTAIIEEPRRFEYENYQGVNSVKEAEQYVLASGISEATDLKGISPKGISKAIGAAKEVIERFGLAPLKFMGPITRDTRYNYKKVRGANAAVFSETKALHLPTKFGDLSEAQKQIDIKRKYAAVFEKERDAIIASGKTKFAPLDKEVISRIQKMKVGQYTWTVTGDNPEDERAKTMYHEFGHVIHRIDKRIGPLIDRFIERVRPRDKGWNLLLSKYADHNSKEYVAEAFALYMSEPEAEHYRIHPDLLTIFRNMDAK